MSITLLIPADKSQYGAIDLHRFFALQMNGHVIWVFGARGGANDNFKMGYEDELKGKYGYMDCV